LQKAALDHAKTSCDANTPGDHPMRSSINSGQNKEAFRLWPRIMNLAFLALVVLLILPFTASAQTPVVRSQAPDFTLRTPSGRAVRMSHLLGNGPLVLIVLRGYPGYQCPFCQMQVHDFIVHAGDFAAKHAKVLLVYPGPSENLNKHAKEFLATESQMPTNIVLVVDPDYVATNLYGLRWDAPHETAYPSTLILGSKGKILFEKVSHSHGDRLSAEEALEHLRSGH
jgi:peroxiredoxin